MPDEPVTMSTTPADAEAYSKVAARLALQAVLGALFGLILFLVLYLLGHEVRTARGWGLVAGLVGFFMSRSLIPVSLVPPENAPVSETALLIRWLGGLLLVLVCGWGTLYVGLFLTQNDRQNTDVALAISGVLSLGVFLTLERNYWLSRFMGLRVNPAWPWWLSAIFFWMFGVAGLFFRSTNPEKTAGAEPRKGESIRPVESAGREVVETVVFVVILVLLLKAFAAEAFVIPTGSMAETLYGYQKLVTCPSCTVTFPVNCSNEVDPPDGKSPQIVTGCTCPNCRQHIRLVSPARERRQPIPGKRTDPDGRPYVEILDPGWSSGDRVLVGKFLYDPLPVLGRKPERLDVVVFKFPGEFDPTYSWDREVNPLVGGPQKNGVAMNYIKRLIGLPGETIAISGGDVYALPPEKSPKYKEDPKVKAIDLWRKNFTHEQNTLEGDLKKAWEDGQFEIVRKSPSILQSIMRPVYENDRPAADLQGREWQRWQTEESDKSWEQLEGGKVFRHGHSAETTANLSWLRYHHRLRGQGGFNSLVTDFLGYNAYEYLVWKEDPGHWVGPGGDRIGQNWIGDLILECEVKIEKAEGELVLELVKSGERFQASWDLASPTGVCTLKRLAADGTEKERWSKPTRLRRGSHRLRFANVDQELTVWVDNSVPFEDERVRYKVGDVRGPTSADLQPASIGVRNAAVTVRKINLYRDTYFALGATEADVAIPQGDPKQFTAQNWERLQALPTKMLYVQPGHYLCLGDNSMASSDGRSWGQVPERLLLGRALVVYYPFRRAGRIR